MYARSARFDRAVRYGAVENGAMPVTKIDAYRAGRLVAADVPFTRPSSVTVDESAGTWRTCELTVVDLDRSLIPKNPQAALAPYGTDLFIQTGFRFADGTTELLPMGVFRILVGRPTRKGHIAILGYDYSKVVARARFEQPVVFPTGFSRSAAIAQLIEERVFHSGTTSRPILTYNVADDSDLPLTIFEEGERYGTPWKAVTDLAEAAGQQVLFLPNGPYPTALLRPAPSLTTSIIAWTFKEGEGETMVDVKPEQNTIDTGYNVYVVTGESSELAANGAVPVRASAEVTDPRSPVYPGTYGRVPTFLATSFVRTQAQAQAVADANLPLKAGGSERIDVVAFAHPAHEAGDIVWVTEPYLAIDSAWIISRFRIDLTLKEHTEYACRAKRVA